MASYWRADGAAREESSPLSQIEAGHDRDQREATGLQSWNTPTQAQPASPTSLGQSSALTYSINKLQNIFC